MAGNRFFLAQQRADLKGIGDCRQILEELVILAPDSSATVDEWSSQKGISR